ncbi:CBL-interacting protein kinase 18 [Apostasia shenzhenica]|uniref:non-specific serine/threonine protein kinase n=1 Tax=Apostasia shenzhenica TaxID=1088818 RepID=A0A2I0A4W0_9ASPA|nr:CBL-interacting protein kinase 18 [Apostasia shenzhenica]
MEIKGSVLMQKYEIGRLLGQGTFAKVYYARNISTGESVAIKMIDKDKALKIGLIDQIKREISIMKIARHHNIVQLYEVMATKSKIYFVMEYVKGGELFIEVSKGRLKEDVARKYFQQLISAIEFCHDRGIYHRDLKPENLLLDETGDLKVSDFGLSALSDSKRQDGLFHTTCGTPAYVAPEVIWRKGYDGAKADIWSCGVILFVLMAGYLPFHDSNLMEMYRKIGKAEFKCPNQFPRGVRRLLSKILDPNPCTRITISKIMSNTWFRKGFDEKRTIETESKEMNPLDVNISFSSKDGNVKPTIMNAFDIISLSAGFNLSGLFVDTNREREARFTSSQPAAAIVLKLEEVAKRLRLMVQKKDGGVMKMEASKMGRRGVLAFDVEIFEVTPLFHLVEVRITSGNAAVYEKFWNEDIKPALQDVVWAWQGQPGNLQQLQT